MNFYEINKLCCDAPKNRGERLPHFDSLIELRPDEVYQVLLISNEAIIGMQAVPRGSWIVPETRSEATGRCPAKSTEFNHCAFTGVHIARQLIKQLTLFQAEQA